MTGFSVSIEQTIVVPESVVLDVLEMAGYGIAYWALSATIYEDRQAYHVHIADPDDVPDSPAQRDLKFEWIAKRLVQLGTGHPFEGVGPQSSVAGYARANVAALLADPADPDCDIDADLADVVVQLTYFGKVIFR